MRHVTVAARLKPMWSSDGAALLSIAILGSVVLLGLVALDLLLPHCPIAPVPSGGRPRL